MFNPVAFKTAQKRTALSPLTLRCLTPVLLSNSDSAVCRLMEMPQASSDQTHRMVALRLETELPYPVPESTWVCQRQAQEDAAEAGRVLVMATPTAEISEAVMDPAWHWVGTGPGHGIQLRSGRIVIPCWAGIGERFCGQSQMSFVLYSDDGGRTWERALALDHDT